MNVSLSVCNGVAGQTVGPILTKICMWCSFSTGSDIGESNFFIGVPEMGAHFMPKNEKMAKKGSRWPPIKKLHKIKVVEDPPKRGTG